MAYNLKEAAIKPERLTGGHRMCAGCGAPVIVRQILDVYEAVKSVEGRNVREDFRGQLYGRLTKTGRLDRRRVKNSFLTE